MFYDSESALLAQPELQSPAHMLGPGDLSVSTLAAVLQVLLSGTLTATSRNIEVPLSLLKDAALTVTITDNEGTESKQVFKDFTLSEAEETELTFALPIAPTAVRFDFTAGVRLFVLAEPLFWFLYLVAALWGCASATGC